MHLENEGTMNRLPIIRHVTVNQGSTVCGSFLDPEYVFHYIESGYWSFRVHSRTYTIEPGNVLLIPPHVLHVVKPLQGENLVQYVIHFLSQQNTSDSLKKLPIALQVKASDQDRIKNRFMDILAEWQCQDPGYTLVVSGMVTELLGIYMRNAAAPLEFEHVSAQSWPQIESAVEYLQHNFENDALTIDHLSKAACLSLPHFCRIFKKHMGYSPHQYLNYYRIEKAREYLLSGKFNCSEVAEKTGFASIYVFSKVFKKIEGVSPTEWLKQAAQIV